MKKRMAALVMCAVLTCTLIAAPRARAVVVEATAATLGIAVLGSYMTAIGLNIGADTGETVSSGLTSMVSDYLTDTGSTDTAQSWLEYIAGFASMPVAGSLKLPASVVKTIGFFVDWVLETFGLDEAGDIISVLEESTHFISLADGSSFPLSYLDSSGTLTISNEIPLSSFTSTPTTYFTTETGVTAQYYTYRDQYCWDYISSSGEKKQASDSIGYISSIGAVSVSLGYKAGTEYYSNFFIDSNGKLVADYFCVNVNFLSPIESRITELTISRSPEFTQPDIGLDPESATQMMIDLGYPAGTTLEQVAEDVPAQIAAGTLAPTYELTGTGEGTDTEDGTTVGLLQSILQGVKAIPDAFTNSLTDVFTPSQEAVDSLATTVNTKLPLIGTLQDFGGDISYYLQHPEECANGLSLTTVVDLGKGRGTYLGDSQQDILDVSWYLEYKPMVDDIIVGFAWLIFLWNCYGALPRILHGEGTIAESIEVIKDGDGK